MTDKAQPEQPRSLARAAARWMGLGRRAPAPSAPKVAPPHSMLNHSIVDCAVYADGVRLPGKFDYAEALAQARRYPHAYVWLGLREPNAEEFAWVAKAFDLHELTVEEATSHTHRPRIGQYGEHSRLVLRTADYVEHAELDEWSEVVETGHIVIFIGPRYVITVRHGAPGALAPVRADLETHRKLLALGPWAVAYGICDRLVDSYLEVADRVEEDVNRLEDAAFARQRSEHLAHIYQLKRELMEFRRAVVPLQRPLLALLEDRSQLPDPLRRYFRDVAEHLSRVVDQVNAYDELLNSVVQARLAQLTVDQNNDMRKIASYAAMAVVPTAVAGIYGMNFDDMPELGWRYGYPGVMVLMVIVVLGMYRSFRRSGWL